MRRQSAHWTRSPLALHLVDLAPLLAVVMFIVAGAAMLGYLHLVERWHQQETLQQDATRAQQQARDHLRQQREQLARLASEQIRHKDSGVAAFTEPARQLLQQYPELLLIGWVDAHGNWLASVTRPGAPLRQAQAQKLIRSGTTASLPAASATSGDARYHVYAGEQALAVGPMAALQIPVLEANHVRGELVAFYSLHALLNQAMPRNPDMRYAVALLDNRGTVLAGQSIAPRAGWWHRITRTMQAQEVVVPLLAAEGGLALRTQAWPTHAGLAGNISFWLTLTLFGLTTCLLIANWLQARRSGRALQALQTETSFRRTMENSMRTGLRVLDLDGRISYVNPAFCEMTGWTREELIGQTAPYSFWPPEQHERLHRCLREELTGGVSAAGMQVSLRRKNGSQFEARLYISPLIDSNGRQTGWMASMTDITEPNRVRWQLAAARKRFITVLEALGSSVSVASIGGVELLFANTLYRHWFGASADGHLRMALKGATASHDAASTDDQLDQVDSLAGFPLETLAAETPDEHTEIYIERLGKWVEVRSRYLHWVDGRLVQMIIATDVTARHEAEERAAAQADHAEAVNRLVTMGEMASSVAHELNQPLTAISNYCTGAISRLDRDQLSPAQLREVLQRMAHQAQRAGQVIRHIRGFVKRSAPRRLHVPARQIVEQVVELAAVELRRRDIALEQDWPRQLPSVYADPVLIEQVLMNLIRNGADAIDAAGRPERRIRLSVREERSPQQTVVRFAVSDTGTGLAAKALKRLYDPFFSTRQDGMGIGLSLCRSIVESHQGRMSVENTYNQDQERVGCCFAFWLPTSGHGPLSERIDEQTDARTTIS
ncbi:MAG: PAS domain S-box protein [Ottowia sp.]|nr:PAS domain S-box protein [Ottowia sp.]